MLELAERWGKRIELLLFGRYLEESAPDEEPAEQRWVLWLPETAPVLEPAGSTIPPAS